MRTLKTVFPYKCLNLYKYGFKLLYEITVVRVPVKVRKTRSLKLGPAAARP
jgi:hypothetical protein